jgi:hypothetical protein
VTAGAADAEAVPQRRTAPMTATIHRMETILLPARRPSQVVAARVR